MMVALLLMVLLQVSCKRMQEIKFELGDDVVETARHSGVPKFQVQKVSRSIIYSVAPVPEGIPVRYTRPGYELSIAPLFSFTLYAEEERSRKVDEVSIIIGHITSHEAAHAFAEQMIAQFQKGKWKRHIPESCPAVTGRSSLLDETGKWTGNCPADPDYKLSLQEWLELLQDQNPQKFPKWEWLGDGIFVRFYMWVSTYPEYPGDTRPSYRFSLDFQIDTVRKETDAELEAHDIKEGEIHGWPVAARIAAGKIETAKRIKLLEENAVKRGDRVVDR